MGLTVADLVLQRQDSDLIVVNDNTPVTQSNVASCRIVKEFTCRLAA
ncbi:MAG: hypothetical protein IPI58_01905 [Alphaproteobacteria bacterium]|nr:MAG: hypothetical protein IPI58_01905 [Alphaproteobacteria bacterium]